MGTRGGELDDGLMVEVRFIGFAATTISSDSDSYRQRQSWLLDEHVRTWAKVAAGLGHSTEVAR